MTRFIKRSRSNLTFKLDKKKKTPCTIKIIVTILTLEVLAFADRWKRTIDYFNFKKASKRSRRYTFTPHMNNYVILIPFIYN